MEAHLIRKFRITQVITMEKIKEATKSFFSAIGGYIVLALTAVIGVLVYAFVRKSEQLNSAKAKLDLAETQKEVDLIEAEIKQKQENRNQTKRELEGLDKALDLVAQKRQNIKEAKTDQEIEQYWQNDNNKK